MCATNKLRKCNVRKFNVRNCDVHKFNMRKKWLLCFWMEHFLLAFLAYVTSF